MAATMVIVVATDLANSVQAGAKLFAYAAGTTTPQAMYTDSGLGTPTANPLVCDASGRGVAWLDSTLGDYKLVLKNSAESQTLFSQDNITVGSNPQIIVYPAAFGDISAAELAQLQNIDSTTISALQWGYLGASTAFGGSIMGAADDAAVRGLIGVVDQSVTFASQAEAEAGTDNTKSMNPLRTKQARDANIGTATQAALTAITTFTDEPLPNKVAQSELTISSGSVTPTAYSHTVDTEADAATDNLDTITLTNFKAGDTFELTAENVARAVSVRHGQGNITTATGVDLVLDSVTKAVRLKVDAAGTGVVASFVSTSGSSIKQFNVKDYGATGDGSTDDTTAVNAALAAAVSAGGGEVVFPDAATYVLDGAAATALVNCRITGLGATLTLPSSGSSRSVLLTLTNAQDVQIDGIIFDGQNSTRTGTGVGDFGALNGRTDLPQDALLLLSNSKRLDIQRNTFQNVRIEAIRIADGTGACQDVDIHHNKFSECGFGVWADGEGVAADNATSSVRIHFRFNRYAGVLWNNVAVQYNLCDDMAGSIVEGNYFENSVRPNIALAMCRDVKISKNTCFRNVTHSTKQGCIHVETDCESIQIDGNYTNNSVDGYGILYKQGSDTGSIFNNIVGRCESYGIYLPTSIPNRKGLTPQWTLDEDATSDHIRSTIVSANQLINNDGIRIEKQSTGELQRISITNNIVNKSGSHGIAFIGDTLDDFTDVVIASNIVNAPANDCINLSHGVRCAVTGNVLTSGQTAIALDDTTKTTVTGNTIRSATAGGIVESNASNDNNISGNTISNVSTSTLVRLGSGTRVSSNIHGQSLVLASATTLNLPDYADELINVTGTTQIEGITSTDYWEGRRITFLFSNGVTIKDGIGNLRLAGDFAATGGDTITLIGFGSNFYEIARSDNA